MSKSPPGGAFHVAIEQNVKGPSEVETSSVIENELSAYRAVTPSAVFALIVGLLSILSFASIYFLIFPALAVIFGLKAERVIKKYPDIYTGRNLAQAGLGLGLIFGLMALTVTSVLYVLRANSANAFAKEMEVVLKSGSPEQVVWYMQAPPSRKNLTPEKIIDELRSSGKSAGAPSAFDSQFQTVRSLKNAMAAPGADLHFVNVEKHGEIDLKMFATAVYEVHNPNAKKAEEKEQYVGAVFKSMKNEQGRHEWWIEELRFPYQPNTLTVQEKAVDDGHGHGGDDGHGH